MDGVDGEITKSVTELREAPSPESKKNSKSAQKALKRQAQVQVQEELKVAQTQEVDQAQVKIAQGVGEDYTQFQVIEAQVQVSKTQSSPPKHKSAKRQSLKSKSEISNPRRTRSKPLH